MSIADRSGREYQQSDSPQKIFTKLLPIFFHTHHFLLKKSAPLLPNSSSFLSTHISYFQPLLACS
jgi:hypothetical protein